MNLVELSVKRPVTVTMIMLALACIGLFSYMRLPREMFPELDMPVVSVVTVYPGAGPDEVEQLIAKKLEEQISTVAGIKHLSSISQQGLSIVVAEFFLETDVDVAAADVRAKVDAVREQLPEEAEEPITEKFDFGSEPVLQLAISADRTLKEVYLTTDKIIKDRFATIPDVASVSINGGQEREVQVLVDTQRLMAHNMNMSDVIASVSAANIEIPAGYLKHNSKEYNIRLRGKFESIQDVLSVRVNVGKEGKTVYLRDIAMVLDTVKDIRVMIKASGDACVGIDIQKRAGGNTVAIDKAARKVIKQLEEQLPDDYEISVQNELAPWITSSISNVFSNMYIGIVLTAIALFIFLHSFRGVFIVSLTMPISVLATFIILYLADFSLNMMSLMGLAMTVGVLVNNAILVLENVTRYIHLGHDPKVAAVEGTSEIGVAVISTTLTNIVVFVPIAFMGGIVGQFFRDFGLSATFATIVSLIISFSLAPMLAAKLLTEKNTGVTGDGFLNRIGRGFDQHLVALRTVYSGALNAVLKYRLITVIIVFALLVGSFLLAGQIGGEFITNMDQGKFSIIVEMPVGTHLDQTAKAVDAVEVVLNTEGVLPELVGTYAGIGVTFGGEGGEGSSQSVNIAQINVTLTEKTQRPDSTKTIINRLRPHLSAAAIPGARIKVFEQSGGGGGGAAIQMVISGDDMNDIQSFADEALAIIKDSDRVEGAIDVDTNFRLGQPEVHIIPDRDKCLDYGIDSKRLSQIVASTFEGLIISEYREGAYDYDIRVRGDLESREGLDDIERVTIMTAKGRVPLPELAEIERVTGPSQLFRLDRQSQITISCGNSGKSSGQVVNSIREHLEPVLAKYPGCHITYRGEIEMMEETNENMMIALVMAVALTYMLLASLLESFTQPLVIMFSLPLSLIGVFVALYLMGGTFSMFSVMSIVMLVGLVINNSIVVIDYVNTLRKRGLSRHDAILEAGTTRLRPILMANLTTVVALIPLAMGLGWGGEMRASMAMVQIGGLVVGGWMGLIIIPVIYTLSDDFNIWVKRVIFRMDITAESDIESKDIH